MALAAVRAILFITFLDNTIVSVALADIQSSLSVSVSGLQWIIDGYLLAFAALMLTGGTLGDLFGRKKVMLGASRSSAPARSWRRSPPHRASSSPAGS